MARPARVRIRSRNPCVRARRRLFGWKVRLLTAVVLLVLRRSIWVPPRHGSPGPSDTRRRAGRKAPPSAVDLTRVRIDLLTYDTAPLSFSVRPAAVTGLHPFAQHGWQLAVHRETLAAAHVLWRHARLVSVPFLGQPAEARTRHGESGRLDPGENRDPAEWRVRGSGVHWCTVVDNYVDTCCAGDHADLP